MIREDYLQQSAFDEVDTYCSLKKQNLMLKTILLFHQHAMDAIASGVQLKSVLSLKVRDQISRMKEIREENLDQINNIIEEMKKEFVSIKGV